MLIPTLQTERLTLRAPQASDLDAYVAFSASGRSKGVGGPYSRFEAVERLAAVVGHWQLDGFGKWMVADRKTDAPLGVVGLMQPDGWPEPEIAWTLFDNAEGKGIAQEAATASRYYAYNTLGWSTVISCAAPNNRRSIALAERMGAVEEPGFIHAVYGALRVFRHLSAEACK